MLEAIFYARFHPERGPSVVHQYPNHSIVSHASIGVKPFLNFSNISSYIIPAYDLCDRPLSVCVNGTRVLGFPVSLEDEKYERNRFTFNVCFVLSEGTSADTWTQVVSKIAAFFKVLEEEDGILQREEETAGLKWAGDETYPATGVGVVHALLRSTFNDLNAYGETCVRVDEIHVLNLRLTILRAAPPKVNAWDVPLLVRSLPEPGDWTWDLTIQRIYKHVDGVKHVQRIAELADVERKLVKRAIRELLYHERVIILDIFHFQAIYVITSDFTCFVQDKEMQKECIVYIAVDPNENDFRAGTVGQQGFSQPTKRTILELYRDLQPGVNLQEFCHMHEARLSNIDIRRLITFGVIKGFINRVHKYALALPSQAALSHAKLSNGCALSKPRSNEEAAKEIERAWKKAALTSGWATPPAEVVLEGSPKSEQEARATNEQAEGDTRLNKFLDGRHCMDEACVAMHLSEKKVVERIRSGSFGEVVFFFK